MNERVGIVSLYLYGFKKKYINTLRYFEEESKVFHIKKRTYSIKYLDKKIFNQPTEKMIELGYVRVGMIGHFKQFKRALANEMISEKMQKIETAEIERYSKKELKAQTLKYQQSLYESGYEKYNKNFWKNGYLAGYSDKDLARWEVNFLRHEKTQYNHVLWELKNKYKREDLTYNLFETVMLNIRDAYPFLEEEIDRQIQNYFEKYQKYTLNKDGNKDN
jgi:uncharacterized protein YlbG (UPF0298 family)